MSFISFFFVSLNNLFIFEIKMKNERKNVIIGYLVGISVLEIYKFVKIMFFMSESTLGLESLITDYNSRMIAIFAG